MVVLCRCFLSYVVVCVVCDTVKTPCVPAPRALVETHVRVVPVHTGRFVRTHGDVLDGHAGGRVRVIVSSAHQKICPRDPEAHQK